MSVWEQFGFRENPYTTSPISASDEGERLLVGREPELRRLLTYLESSSTHPTIEGANGVGKTSLVAVAGYRALVKHRTGATKKLFLPMPRAFQLVSGKGVDDFKREVYLEVAQAFINYESDIRRAGFELPDTKALNAWLNTHPSYPGSAVTSSVTAQTSSGFDNSGFFVAVERWLKACFTKVSAGAFICLMDNLEILETSREARQLIEALRDSLFSIRGLRWVLCGARGIVRTVASSPRLQGVLADPIELEPVSDADVAEVVNRRISEFRTRADAFAPVGSGGFRLLYDVVNRSLRDTLKF